MKFGRTGPVGNGRVGAVVCGGCFQGLGIVRSLGRRRIPVVVVDDEHSIARFSRYTAQAVRVKRLREEEDIVATVLDVAERLGLAGWVLYPTREEMVAAFSRNRELLATRFRVPTPDWGRVRWAWDKRNTYALARRLGVPVPRTWSDPDEVDADPPFAVKPAIKEHFLYATKAKAWRANTRDELKQRFHAAAALVGPGEVLVQELIPGDGRQQFAYCAFFKDGEPLGEMVARRWRQHPGEFGRASTFVETIELPELEELSLRLLREIDYYGLVEIEYKRDPRDGEYKLLDINPRTWGYHTLGQRAGVDFPYLLYADQVGEPVGRQRARAGVGWLRALTDVPTAAVELAARRLDWREYLRSLLRIDTEAVFALDDPLPALVELALVPYLVVKRGY
jgi:D-aspartate ligase